jgi:putative membrane protein
MMDNWNGGGWGWGAWFAMAFTMLAFWGLIVAVVIVAFRTWGHRPESSPAPGTTSEDDALRVLDNRFARGEIDAEEYTSRRDLLRKR